ncbi:hypothetical protein [Parvibacter caecicola]|uniref:hypothetical protein n=1 Tax=Parvibacter caecicola TaxID=747645 RepID=UPI00273143FC|nr:hypothetical protein [Parvibacter caecicola]
MSKDEASFMVCDDRAEFKFRDEPHVALDPAAQAMYDELAEKLLAAHTAKKSQAA